MITVVLEGGIVQAVVDDMDKHIGEPIRILDYDTDGADEEDLTDVIQSDGSVSQAYVGICKVEKAQIEVVEE